jgi:AcrR family transcriptional regulator
VATDQQPLTIVPPQSEAGLELPVAGQAPRRRADATRNHELVLCTARRLFAERGPHQVSMDAIAAAAGVGKGTIFRAFGDRAGLIGEILGEDESVFQDAVIRGPAPLGPGAPAITRITAFGRAYMDFLEGHLDLLVASELGTGVRFRKGPFQLYRTHLVMLVREAVADATVDAEYLADVLLAPLAAEFFAYQRRVRERPLAELDDAYACLAERLLRCR